MALPSIQNTLLLFADRYKFFRPPEEPRDARNMRLLSPDELAFVCSPVFYNPTDLELEYRRVLSHDLHYYYNIRQQAESLVRVWDAVIEGKLSHEAVGGGGNKSHRFKEAFVLSHYMIPRRAGVGLPHPVELGGSGVGSVAPVHETTEAGLPDYDSGSATLCTSSPGSDSLSSFGTSQFVSDLDDDTSQADPASPPPIAAANDVISLSSGGGGQVGEEDPLDMREWHRIWHGEGPSAIEEGQGGSLVGGWEKYQDDELPTEVIDDKSWEDLIATHNTKPAGVKRKAAPEPTTSGPGKKRRLG